MATAPLPGAGKRAEAEQVTLVFELEGKRYVIRPAEIPASLAREYRRETGGPFQADMTSLAKDLADIDTVQNLVWLARRQSGEQITLADVDDFTYDHAKSLKFVDADEVDEDDPNS